MDKDFDNWGKLKKKIHYEYKSIYAHKREVWWCSLGINIGVEVDGKNTNFERPVLVIRTYNRETLLILPVTSIPKNDRFHFYISGKFGEAWIKLTQARVISSKRLIRRVDVLDEDIFIRIRKSLASFI